jgi:hypothetical protein
VARRQPGPRRAVIPSLDTRRLPTGSQLRTFGTAHLARRAGRLTAHRFASAVAARLKPRSGSEEAPDYRALTIASTFGPPSNGRARWRRKSRQPGDSSRDCFATTWSVSGRRGGRRDVGAEARKPRTARPTLCGPQDAPPPTLHLANRRVGRGHSQAQAANA